MEVQNVVCPGCGAPQEIGAERCKFCHRPIVVKTLNSVSEMNFPMLNKYVASYDKQLKEDDSSSDLHISIAMCYMKLKLFDKAIPHLSKAMELNFDNGDIYLYYAISLINSKKPFLHSRDEINEIEKYIDAAISIEDKGIYYFLKAYVRYDYFSRKSLYVVPNHKQLLLESKHKGVSKQECLEMFNIMSQAIPNDMFA